MKRTPVARPSSGSDAIAVGAVQASQNRAHELGSSAAAPREPLIIFFHIAKTGGSTLRSIIRRHYRPDTVYFIHLPSASDAQLEGISRSLPPQTAVVTGHLLFGLHRFLARQCTYTTLLREPVDRVISYYYMVVKNTRHEDHQTVLSESITLKEYASGSRFLATDNRQTRLLSGRGPSPEPCTADMLELAKANLREYFSVVGLTERFDETLLLLKRTFGWRGILYSRRNVGVKRPEKASVDTDTLKAIEGANRLDIELYEYAQALFREQLSRQRADFETELEAFRRVNGQYAGQPSFLRI